MSNVANQVFGLAFVSGILALSASCDYSGDFLFAGPIDNVPAVLEIKGPDGGALEVKTILNSVDAQEAAIFSEVGPNASTLPSGATFEFIGTGREVCAVVDPETVYWNQSLSGIQEGREWRQPDNIFDDGDMDIEVGLSIYYRGTPGEKMGGFEVQFEDEIGNQVEVDLVACRNTTSLNDNQNAHAGRATTEYCSIQNTQPGVRYTIALEAISLPRDDARLGFGILLADGPCEGSAIGDDGAPIGLFNRVVPRPQGSQVPRNIECLIQGENILPDEAGSKIRFGFEEGQNWPDSIVVEEEFCSGDMRVYCNQEARRNDAAGIECNRAQPDLENMDERCFCGDAGNNPNGGALDF